VLVVSSPATAETSAAVATISREKNFIIERRGRKERSSWRMSVGVLNKKKKELEKKGK
jgi:hypothetical protein